MGSEAALGKCQLMFTWFLEYGKIINRAVFLSQNPPDRSRAGGVVRTPGSHLKPGFQMQAIVFAHQQCRHPGWDPLGAAQSPPSAGRGRSDLASLAGRAGKLFPLRPAGGAAEPKAEEAAGGALVSFLYGFHLAPPLQ